MNYYGTSYWAPTDSISHHGIRGQKWGVRRYQNADGSLTNAGRKRYDQTVNDAKNIGNITSELEKMTRQLTSGVQKGQKILVPSDVKNKYKALLDDYMKQTNILNHKYSFVQTDIKSMDDGYDYVQVLLEDKKLKGYYVEYLSLIGKSK